MKLKNIDKKTYRSRLNIVIIAFVLGFALLAVTFGSIFIALFSYPELTNTAEGQAPNNFRFNFLGVIVALLTCGIILNRLKNKTFFDEIYYIWQLKQIQNIIYRRLKKIKQASQSGDITAIIILNFYYQSLKQLYVLDDNTITLSSLNSDIEKLELLINQQDRNVTTDQFEQTLLSAYK
jgi:hypothetical protein